VHCTCGLMHAGNRAMGNEVKFQLRGFRCFQHSEFPTAEPTTVQPALAPSRLDSTRHYADASSGKREVINADTIHGMNQGVASLCADRPSTQETAEANLKRLSALSLITSTTSKSTA
jgi:hypothetical protein